MLILIDFVDLCNLKSKNHSNVFFESLHEIHYTNDDIVFYDINLNEYDEKLLSNTLDELEYYISNPSDKKIIVNVGIISLLLYSESIENDSLANRINAIIESVEFNNVTNFLITEKKTEHNTENYNKIEYWITKTYNNLNETVSNNNLRMFFYGTDTHLDNELNFILSNTLQLNR